MVKYDPESIRMEEMARDLQRKKHINFPQALLEVAALMEENVKLKEKIKKLKSIPPIR